MTIKNEKQIDKYIIYLFALPLNRLVKFGSVKYGIVLLAKQHCNKSSLEVNSLINMFFGPKADKTVMLTNSFPFTRRYASSGKTPSNHGILSMTAY